jgi:hypothetical protein
VKARPTIFLSGVSHEFGTFRDAVENEIEMKGCFAENQHGFAPDYQTVEAMLTRRIGESDAVFCIIGFRFGAEPNHRPPGAARRSYTQMEFDVARRLGKPVFLFLSKDATVRDTPKADEQPEDTEAQALQLAHRDAVTKANHLYYHFKGCEELCKLAAEIPIVAEADFKEDIGRVLKHAGAEPIGRDDWFPKLDAAALDPAMRIVSLIAFGGVGKTTLVAHWLSLLAAHNWRVGKTDQSPGVPCDRVFGWSFYSQGTSEDGAASADQFIAQALTFFGDATLAASNAGPWDKGVRLAQLVTERPSLLVLDGLEPLQHPPGPLTGPWYRGAPHHAGRVAETDLRRQPVCHHQSRIRGRTRPLPQDYRIRIQAGPTLRRRWRPRASPGRGHPRRGGFHRAHRRGTPHRQPRSRWPRPHTPTPRRLHTTRGGRRHPPP